MFGWKNRIYHTCNLNWRHILALKLVPNSTLARVIAERAQLSWLNHHYYSVHCHSTRVIAWFHFSLRSLSMGFVLAWSSPHLPSPALWLSLFLSSDCSIEGISKATGLKINTMGDSIKSPWMVYMPWSSLHRVAFPQIRRPIPYVGIELLNRSMTGTLLLLPLLTRWKDP